MRLSNFFHEKTTPIRFDVAKNNQLAVIFACVKSLENQITAKKEYMLSSSMNDALNRQINEELLSAYLYLAMSAKSDSMGLSGFANWFKMQYQEELAHADRFFNYILERNGEVDLDSIGKPEVGDVSPLELFEKSLSHEQHITKCIFQLKDLAKSESDHATDVFLEWFVSEQVEEEATTQGVIDQLRLVKDNPSGLFLIDRELSGRKMEVDGDA